jgi:hypothetical protein
LNFCPAFFAGRFVIWEISMTASRSRTKI